MENSKKSFVTITAAMLIFGTIGIFRKYISLPSSALAFSRGVIGSVFILLFCMIRKRPVSLKISGKKWWLLLTGALMGINWMLLFEAYNYTSIAAATLSYYMEPTIVILLSPVFFKEKLTLRKGVCALLSVIGMAFVAGIFDTGLPPLSEIRGILYGLGAAALYAAIVIINKKLPGMDAYERTVTQLGTAALIMVPYLFLTMNASSFSVPWYVWALVAVVGLIHTGFAYVMYFGSIDGLKAQSVAILSYIDPVSALIFAAVFLGEGMSLYEFIGMVLILGATAFSELVPDRK